MLQPVWAQDFVHGVQDAPLSVQPDIFFASDGEEIGRIYAPFQRNYYYTQHPDLLKNTTYLQRLITLTPSSASEAGYKEELQIRNPILTFLNESGILTDADYQQALDNEQTPITEVSQTPYFTSFAIDQAIAQYPSAVNEGNTDFYTSVDVSLYALSQQIVQNGINNNIRPVNGDAACLVASNPQTGEIITMIGGYSYDQSHINMCLIPRHQGSAMKPFVYVKAFEMGYSPQTTINDAPISFGSYVPTDYLGTYMGNISIDQALNQSVNIPALKMLNTIGYDNGLQILKDVGISLDPKMYYGLPLVLGDAEIPVYQMVGGYNAFANGGFYAQTTPFHKITENRKTIFDIATVTKKRVIDENAVAMLDAALGDTQAKYPLYGSSTQYYSIQGRPYGAKDGTSNGPQDIDVYEFIPQLTVGVWAGNVDGSFLSQSAVGVAQTGPMAHEFMMDYIQRNNLPVENFPAPNYPTLDGAHQNVP